MATIVEEDSAQRHKCGFQSFSECAGRPIRTVNEELIKICFYGIFHRAEPRFGRLGSVNFFRIAFLQAVSRQKDMFYVPVVCI